MRRLSLAVLALMGLTACSSSSPSTSGASSSTGPRSAALHRTRKLEGNVTPGPVLGPGGVLYSTSNEGTLHALDPLTGVDVVTGKVLFDPDTGATIDSYPALGDGLLVVGVTDGRLLAVGA